MEAVELTTEQRALVENNVALAKFLFGEYFDRFRKNIDYDLDADDLMSQAYLGLIRSAQRWRSYGEEHGYSEESIASGYNFGAFARKGIIGQMLDSLRKLDHVHTLVRKNYKVLVQNGFGTEGVTEELLAERTGIPLEKVQRVIRLVHARPVSLDEPSADEEGYSKYDSVSDDSDVEASTWVVHIREAFVTSMDDLTGVQQVIIAMKYFEGQELPAIASRLTMGLAYVRKEHTKALYAIHAAMHHQAHSA